jgi:hypothetical protein
MQLVATGRDRPFRTVLAQYQLDLNLYDPKEGFRVSQLLAFSQKKQEDVLPGNLMVTKTVTVAHKQQSRPSLSGSITPL